MTKGADVLDQLSALRGQLPGQVQTMAVSRPTTDPLTRPMGPHYLDALRGQNGADRRQMTPEWMAYQQQLEALRAAKRGMNGKEKGGIHSVAGQPVVNPSAPGLPMQQIAPVNPQGFAPPGMVGSSYAVRGLTPGQTPFDLPTY